MGLSELVELLIEFKELVINLKDLVGLLASAYFAVRFIIFAIFGFLCATSGNGAECIGNWLIDLIYWIFGPLFLAANVSNVEPFGGIAAVIIIFYWYTKWHK